MFHSETPLGPLSARCATHPEEEASGTCARCGTFFCAGCVRSIAGKAWCATCAARPEINYLEQFRLKLWGRRDGSTWMVLGVGLAFGVAAFTGTWTRAPALVVLTFLAGAGTGVCFFMGLRWAREALVGVPLGFALVCSLQELQGFAVFLTVIAFSGLIVYADTRNQLFFRRPVSRKRLERLWHLRENNPIARRALSLGLGAFLLPMLSPLAILCGILGLRRVDPEAIPPIGRKAEAVGGIVLGLVSMVMWGMLLWPRVRGMFSFSVGE